MKKKSIMGLEYKWEVLLVYLVSILGLVFSCMKDKKIDKDVKFQYNQSGTIFIINIAASIFVSALKTIGIPFVGIGIVTIQFIIWVFVIITVVEAFQDRTYRIPVIADLSEKIFK